MGDAPGPVGDNLQIEVNPDPFFQSIAENDQRQFVGFVKPIRINVSDSPGKQCQHAFSCEWHFPSLNHVRDST